MFEFSLSEKKLTGGKILIVDDEPLIVQILQACLEAKKYQVITACNGSEGLQKALTEKPDLILLDRIMPDTGGYEMLENLRCIDEGKGIAVIILSACKDNPSIARTNACAVDDYIVKPFDIDTLLAKIEVILETKCAVWCKG